ncbi:MAG: hypothetical protein ACK5LC_00185 [Coprobacillaceae bacterium]
MTNSSRVKKYKDLREGIKEEAGINREVVSDIQETSVEDDEFLSFVNKKNTDADKKIELEDTITEAKTFEQLSKESNAELDKALKSAKTNVGKEEHYNTRLDILNKIRNPEKEVIKIDKMENMRTEQFAKGYFIKEELEEKDEVEEKPQIKDKKKMTLMERLASISPKEDVEKAEKAMQGEKEEAEVIPQPMQVETPVVEEKIEEKIVNEETTVVEKNRDEKIVTILNYAIIALVVVFVVVCIMIIYQIFF